MKLSRTHWLKKSMAAVVSAALLTTVPGFSCWQAVAQTVVNAGSQSSAASGSHAGLGVINAFAVKSLAPGNMNFLPNVALGNASNIKVNPLAPSRSLSLPKNVSSSRFQGIDNIPSVSKVVVNESVRGMNAGQVRDRSVTASFLNNKKNSAEVASDLELLSHPETVSRPASEIASMPAGSLRHLGQVLMDPMLRTRSADLQETRAGIVAVQSASQREAPVSLRHGAEGAALAQQSVPAVHVQPASPAPRSASSWIKGALWTLASLVSGAGFVLAAQKAAVLFLPAIFGVLPVAAVWAVSSGLLILPAAAYTRYRLALRDSSRLRRVKVLADAAMGAALGAVLLAVPGLLPVTAAAVAAVHAPITLGSLLGMMALPAMVLVSFNLRRIIYAAESGKPFSISSNFSFPTYTWVLMGVVFAIFTGYTPVYVNAAIALWQFLGTKSLAQRFSSMASWMERFKLPLAGAVRGLTGLNVLWKRFSFDAIYLGALGYAAVTAFASPITFLVLAFSVERAAVWTTRLLMKLLPKSQAAPSSIQPVPEDPDGAAPKPAKWPKFNFWLRVGFFSANLFGLGLMMATFVFGWKAFLTNIGIAGAMAFIPFWFGTWIIKKLYHSQPANEEQDPEVFAVMKELRERINAERAKSGKKPIPLPEIHNVPMEVPNAFATGRSPFHALVGITEPFKQMTLNPENVRAGLLNLMVKADADMLHSSTPKQLEGARKRFAVFRLFIAGSISGLPKDATPEQVSEALRAADVKELNALGVRAMRSVMGHELTHVMQRHMLIGTMTATITSAIAFSSYHILYKIARYAQQLWAKIRKFFETKTVRPSSKSPRKAPGAGSGLNAADASGAKTQEFKPAVIEPVITGTILVQIAVKLAAMWGPIIAQILQMTVGRQDEGLADEGGALLSEDPEALATGLGLLTTWRPPTINENRLRQTQERLSYMAALSHLLTVNPLEQLRNAGMLPRSQQVDTQGRPMERQDDWMFNLFVTHPDTDLRIERLYDMAEARRAGAKP